MPQRRTRLVLWSSIALGPLALTGCTQVMLTASDPTASPSAPVSASPSASSADPSPSATPSASAAPVGIPAACTKVVSPDAYAGIFGATPLNDPGVVDPSQVGPITPMPAAPDAAPGAAISNAVSLRCVWRDPGADITSISIEYSTVAGATASAYSAELGASGYTCADANGGSQCQNVGTEPQYGVAVAHTVLARDGIVISVTQANFPTDNLMAQLAAAVWGE